MLPILAEADLPVTAIQIGVWIGCASFVLGMVRHIMGIKADNVRINQGTAETPLHLAHPLVMSASHEPALKLEVEGEFDKIDNQLTALRKHLDSRLDALNHAGEMRMEKLTSRLDAEIRLIRADLETRCQLIHEKINSVALHVSAHDEGINNLKTADYRHDQIMQGIQQKILNGVKPR